MRTLFFLIKAWRWSQTQVPLFFQTDIDHQLNNGYKAVEVQKGKNKKESLIIASVVWFVVFGQNSSGVQVGVNLFEDQMEKQKDLKAKGCRGV